MDRRGLVRLLTFALALWLPGPGIRRAAAQERSLEIRDFHVDLRVGEDGDLRVLEAITVRFNGHWNGIFRTIPVEYREPSGLRYRLRLHVESITDNAGRALWFEQSREGISRKLKIAVPGAEDAVRSVNISYHVPNALKFFDEHDELYWNVTGTEWPVAIRHASARVELPTGVTGLRAAGFQGPYGSSEQASVEETEDGFYFESDRPLALREGLTVVVGWDPGVVARPGPLARFWSVLRSNWLFFFPFLTFWLMYRIWHSRGRDPERRAIMPEYEPPGELSPAEAGTLIDNSPDMRDITATVVDLAVRGFLRIEEEVSKKLLGLLKDTDYRFVRLKVPEEWSELHRHERALLKALFSGGRTTVRMSDLEHEFYKDLPDIKDGLWDRLLALGYYDRRPDRVLAGWIGGAVAFLIVCVAGAMAVANVLFLSHGWALLAAILTALPVFAFGVFMPARTELGVRGLEKVMGFQDFLDRVEQDRFKRMITSPEMFERYLPYAMALGVDRKWAQAFEDIYREPPEWYVGASPQGFRTTYFVAHMSDFSTSVATAMSSQPRSTGGSGFGGGGGGGGFSGGGFGGGGGGGW